MNMARIATVFGWLEKEGDDASWARSAVHL